MSWPGFFAPMAAWLFLLIGLLVLLYFLKINRPRQQVSSLVLWRQVLNDNRVNSPLQKFKRNLLLLLQLLLLVLLILAAMQPYMRGNISNATRLPIVIDSSASMAALNGPAGISRLEVAKQQVARMIDGLAADQQLCLISFADSAKKLCDFTSNKRSLRKALDAVTIEEVPSETEDALRLCAALAAAGPFESVMLISDGNFPTDTDFALPFKLEYQRIDPAGPNFGITALNARRSGRGKWSVFALVEGSQPAGSGAAVTADCELELFQDGKSAGARSFTLSQGQAYKLTFDVAAEKATALEVRLNVDQFDSLQSDNVAYLDLEPARRLRVFVPETLESYRAVLEEVPDVALISDSGQNTTETDFDLVISNRIEDLSLTASARFFVDLIPEKVQPLIEIAQNEQSAVVDWLRSADVLRYVELGELVVADEVRLVEGKDESSFEELGYEWLIYGRHGPMLLRRRNGHDLTYHMLFHADRSTLVYRIGFPILVTNLVNIAMNQAHLAEAPGQRTGVLRGIPLPAHTQYTVTGPSGSKRPVSSDDRPILRGVPAPYVGRYRIDQGGTALRQIGASLLSAPETSLLATEKVQFKEQAVDVSTVDARTDYSYWRWLVVAGLCVLIFEWWYFHRKPGALSWGRPQVAQENVR